MVGVKHPFVNYFIKVSVLNVNSSSQIFHIDTLDEIRKTEALSKSIEIASYIPMYNIELLLDLINKLTSHHLFTSF